LAGVEGTSKAKDLIERALAADPNLQTRLQDIKKKIAFVGGQPDILATGGVDSRVLRKAIEDLATKDQKIAGEFEQIYKDLQTAVRTKANELYPQPSSGTNLFLLIFQQHHHKLPKLKLITQKDYKHSMSNKKNLLSL
jgi:hypothetical protein